MSDDKIQDNTVINGVSRLFCATIFRLSIVKLRFQTRDLNEVMSYRTKNLKLSYCLLTSS